MAKNLEERVKELEKQVAQLKGKAALKLSKKLVVGDTFDLAGLKWKILDITEKGYMCLADKLCNMTFGSSNDWKESKIRKYLNEEFYGKLVEAVGDENIIPMERDLFSLDGQTEYGKCEDKVSIISLDEYRKYRPLIPNTDDYWWTLTPDSTKCNKDTTYIRVVCPSGVFSRIDYDFVLGVRPVCIFSSAIFESEEE